jgi:hypothetical protein
MRPLKLLLLTGLFVAMSAPAWAFWAYDYGGDIKFKFTNYDVGHLYDVTDGTYARADDDTLSDQDAINAMNALGPLTADIAPLPSGDGTPDDFKFYGSEDTWGIFVLENIYGKDSLGQYTIDLYTRNIASYEITGMFWGMTDTYLEQYLDKQNNTIQDIRGIGLQAAFYRDWESSVGFTAFDPSPGPGARSGYASYPTATDGELLWTMFSVPGTISNSQEEFVNEIEPEEPPVDVITGGGSFVAELGPVFTSLDGSTTIEGDYQDALVDNPSAHDLSFAFDATTNGRGLWLVQSDDPALATATPELSSASLMLLGLLPMGLVAWRRRKS